MPADPNYTMHGSYPTSTSQSPLQPAGMACSLPTSFSLPRCHLRLPPHSSIEHPGVVMVAMEKGKYYVSGPLKGLNKPTREFPCKTPQEVRGPPPRESDHRTELAAPPRLFFFFFYPHASFVIFSVIFLLYALPQLALLHNAPPSAPIPPRKRTRESVLGRWRGGAPVQSAAAPPWLPLSPLLFSSLAHRSAPSSRRTRTWWPSSAATRWGEHGSTHPSHTHARTHTHTRAGTHTHVHISTGVPRTCTHAPLLSVAAAARPTGALSDTKPASRVPHSTRAVLSATAA